MACDLKRMHKDYLDLMSNECMSFIMGHQSTHSISKYGDPRNGSGGTLPFVVELSQKEMEVRIRTPAKMLKNIDSEDIEFKP